MRRGKETEREGEEKGWGESNGRERSKRGGEFERQERATGTSLVAALHFCTLALIWQNWDLSQISAHTGKHNFPLNVQPRQLCYYEFI